MITDEATERQVAFLLRELALDSPQKILDLACGFGRHANRLAALGHDVTGIDLTPGFLELARLDAQARGVQVNYLQGDMRQIDYQAAFDHVLLMFTAFGYFEDEQNLLVLKNVARALKPGGLLIFDIMNRDTFLKGFLPDHVTEKESSLMIDRHFFDSLSGRLYNRRIVIREGVRRDKPFFIRMYNASEINSLLEQAGLKIKNIYADWDSNPLTIDSRRLVVIAQKV
jgi:SAM-dependent methyltransferase